MAEGEGFEPPELSLNSFQDCRLQPLGHPSVTWDIKNISLKTLEKLIIIARQFPLFVPYKGEELQELKRSHLDFDNFPKLPQEFCQLQDQNH